MNISGSQILITGAGSGIGRYLSIELLEAGATVIALDIDADALTDLKSTHPEISIFQCDVTNPVQVESAINSIFIAFPDLSVLINNAGFIHSEPLINILSRDDKRHSKNTWLKTIDVNLNAVFYVSSNVVALMVANKNKGVVVNISSISANGNIGQSAYAAAKAGVIALSSTWAKELGMFGIRSVAIAPGFFNTDSTRRALSENNIKKWEKATPLGRLGELDELYKAIRFAIEDDFFNGKVLELDGGLSI